MVTVPPEGADTADREIVVSRVINGPRRVVFEAYTELRHLSRWWGPDGFTITTRSFEFSPGGHWDFVMHGPDGTDYPNHVEWLEIVRPERSTPGWWTSFTSRSHRCSWAREYGCSTGSTPRRSGWNFKKRSRHPGSTICGTT